MLAVHSDFFLILFSFIVFFVYILQFIGMLENVFASSDVRDDEISFRRNKGRVEGNKLLLIRCSAGILTGEFPTHNYIT